jgi:RelA/SpoT family (p)ppGpp synthetase
VEVLLSKNGISDFEIKGRIKHYYSIYLKMQRKGISIEEVLDLLAIRVLVKEKIECYESFGVIHLNFRPLISRFKDYIAIPKENGYQTLHTSVFDETNVIEVQIRTYDMHKNAEYGIAAHWKYKLDSATPNTEWLNNLTFENEKIEDFYELAKNDLFREDIIVYSPKFDTFTLPLGATALDFAYAVHTEVGNKAKEAYVNKEKVSLLTTLKNADIVRIVTADEEIPRCSWIDALKTSKAKIAAKHLCNQRIKEVEQDIALNILTTIFDIDVFKLKALIKANYLCSKIYKIVEDKNFLIDVVNKLSKTIKERDKFKYLFKTYKLKEYLFDTIRILSNKPINDIEFSFCCHPKRGDEIVGFLENKKVTIHHKLCSTATDLIKARSNMVYVEWIKETSISKYLIIVNLQNKKGELAKFVTELAKLDISISSIELGVESDFCKVEVEIEDKKLDKISAKLKQTYHIIEFTSLKDAYNGKVK